MVRVGWATGMGRRGHWHVDRMGQESNGTVPSHQQARTY